MKQEIVIVINPGSTSTKIAFFNRSGALQSSTIQHKQADLDQFSRIADQQDYRYEHLAPHIRSFLADKNFQVVGIVGRGGIVKPLQGGTYRINSDFLTDAANGTYGEHASNLGGLLANRLKDVFGLENCYTVDPVSCGNMSDIAEISGVPGIVRDGRGHPLNMKMTARKLPSYNTFPLKKPTM